MAVGGLSRLAAAAPAPVYAVAGKDGLAAVEDISLHPAVSLQATPRHASLLLVCGRVREEDHQALRRLHDQLPHPRATLCWRTTPAPGFASGETIEAEPGGAIHSLWQRLMSGEQSSEDDLLPDEPPAPWRGKGDHGQGGKGMMGSKPYGRPMAMTDEDRRDGLALDAYRACFGPFLPMLPAGLLLELTLQSDVVQSARVLRPPFAQSGADGPLRRIARLLRPLGLAGPAARFLKAARAGTVDIGTLRRSLRWSGAWYAIPPGLGEIAGEDIRARLHRWCDEAQGAAASAPSRDGRLADLLPGLEWSEAILVANSFEHDALQDLCGPGRGSPDQQGSS
ncbi:MAG TPA: hypothetical protein VE631_06205 [Alphaproteobacteria bacterium]|nr:hypothetical protein [Alphaproteobacteria bacterium]